jgi:hypothetical protein
MNARTFWSFAGLGGAGLLLLGLGTLWAQFPAPPQPFMPGPGFGPAHGRFTVAHASEKRIVILDTATGKLYQAKESDLLPFSDLPKVGESGRPARGNGAPRPRGREVDKAKLKEVDEAPRRPAPQ